eukprot:Protomagalhaensia_wolfi_Nauph_80__428@NODE_1237_length_1639_cov_25_061875_g951_i0_p1_GENE_NODE_1237_length_1639_cov_25_061875_g951_i0NODE_1237_length_1639_cov_25_061875_g951_i0_p1_ORF_typecomplete_len307_score48_50DUF2749/PF10907_8/0_44_NODE_1237_length_1639_cov_25_061875_g951_i05981518
MVLSIIAQSQEDHSSSGQKALMVATVIARTTAVRLQDPPHQVHHQASSKNPLRRRIQKFFGAPSSTVTLKTVGPIRSIEALFSKTEPNSASVNPGSYHRRVQENPDPSKGNGGINGIFARGLGSKTKLINAAHEKVYEVGCRVERQQVRNEEKPDVTTSELIKLTLGNNKHPLLHSCARLVPEMSYDMAGTVFIDVFREHARPTRNAMAMIYVVGPHGYRSVYENSPEWFLDSVELTATNLVLALNQYNNSHSKKIKSVRLPLFSGGSCIHPSVSPQQVAQRILRAIGKNKIKGVTPAITCVNFPC